MDAPNTANQMEPASDQTPQAGAPENSRTPMLLLAMSAIAALLMIGVLALQISEYLFYKTPPSVWPQTGSVAAAPATPDAIVPPPATSP